MLRILITLSVLVGALLAWSAPAQAHTACCAGDAAVETMAADAPTPGHHSTHDMPHVPHEEPDGCHHECAGCSSPVPAQATLPVLTAPRAVAPSFELVLPGMRVPTGPPPARPFQVPRV